MLFEHASSTDQVFFQGGVLLFWESRLCPFLQPPYTTLLILNNMERNAGFARSKNEGYKRSHTVSKHSDKQACFCWYPS